MSLKRLDKLGRDVLNIIIYTKSPSMQFYIQNKLRDRYEAHRDYIVPVSTDKELKNAKMDAIVQPFMCPKWLIHVDADSISKTELLKSLERTPYGGITIYWTANYGTYLKMRDEDIVRRQGIYAPDFTFSRLEEGEVYALHKEFAPSDNKLPLKLLDYFVKNYRYDVQAVFDLLNILKSGTPINTRKDIIEKIGLPGNSVASMAIGVLKANPKNDKTKRTAFLRAIKQLEDLTITYTHQTLRNFIISNIDGFIEMKQLQIMGIYGRRGVAIPDAFDEKRLKRLKRFERTVLEDISMPRLLSLKLALKDSTSYNHEAGLINGLALYYDNLKIE